VKPHEARRALSMLWWLQLMVALLPVWLFPTAVFKLGENTERLSVVYFVLALLTLFLNHKPFQRFKQAVIAVGQARATEQEKPAWQYLMHCRLHALWFACVPAWAAALAKIFGLEAPVVILLSLATPILFWLYRTPKQLS